MASIVGAVMVTTISNIVNATDNYTSNDTGKIGFVSVQAEFTRGILNSSLAKNLQMSPADPNAFSGKKKNLKLDVRGDCSDAGSSEY